MIYYGICILTLIKNLKREIPDITQTWYADNSGSLGMWRSGTKKHSYATIGDED